MTVRVSAGYMKSLHELNRQIVREIVAATKQRRAKRIARRRRAVKKDATP